MQCEKIKLRQVEVEENKEEYGLELVDCVKCNQKFLKEEFDYHLCVCKYCDESFLYLDVVEHMEACGNRTEFCDRCNGYILKRNYKLHIQVNNCSRPERPKRNLFELRAEVKKYLRSP